MSNARLIRVTPTISTGAYTANDQVGGIQTLTDACADGAVKLNSLCIIDKDSEAAAGMTLHFFSSLPTVVSVDNGALDISDAEIASKCIGVLSVPSSSFVAVGGCKVATVKDINLDLFSTHSDTEGNKTGNIYVVVSSVDTPTFTATSDLVFSYVLVN